MGGARGSCSGASYKEWRNFMSSNLSDMYEKPVYRKSDSPGDQESEDMEIKDLLREVERFGSSGRTWKERKAIENEKVVAAGGKPLKKHRTPLNVAKPAMKNKKRREQKQLEEDLSIGRPKQRFSDEKSMDKRKAEDRVLKSTEGYFRNGVLNVKHLMHQTKPKKDNDVSHEKISKGNSKGKGNKKGNKKGGGKRRGR